MEGAPVLQNADGDIDMEAVLKLDPDLCLVMSKDLIEPLESNGMNVIYFDWKKTDDIKTAVTLMGEVLNKQDRAEEYLKYFDDMVAEAGTKTSKIADDSKKRCCTEISTSSHSPMSSREWWITTAGGTSVTENSWDADGNKCSYTQEDIP